jgi:hypothetical protein
MICASGVKAGKKCREIQRRKTSSGDEEMRAHKHWYKSVEIWALIKPKTET